MGIISKLPVDSFTFTPNGGSAISVTSADMVYGSGVLEKHGADGDVTTADGKRHHFRRELTATFNAELWGDWTSQFNDTRAQIAGALVVEGTTYYGLMTATYSNENRTTTVQGQFTQAGVTS